jgi:ankyrin repeat protein
MSLLDLPRELLLWIADNLDKAQDLPVLACLNQAANAFFLPYLYHFNVRRQRSSALLWGVLKGNTEFVGNMLRDYQVDVNTTDDKSRTPIFNASRTQNETIIGMLLSDQGTDINWQDKHKQTPLVHAMARKLLSADSPLLDLKPCLNERDDKKRSAIWYAVAHCHESLVQVLLKGDRVIRTSDYRNISPIGLAIAKKSANITRMLLHHPESETGKQ